MKNTLITAVVAGLYGLADAGLATEMGDPSALQRKQEVFQHRLTELAANPINSNLLEPCINGQVSVSGLYPTQADEDKAIAEAWRVDRAAGGQVSAAGR